MVVITISDEASFQGAINSGALIVAHFYADWAPQCASMNDVLEELSNQAKLKSVKFVKCPAEDIPEISLKYDITAVPTFLLLRSGNLVDRVNGADANELNKKIAQQIAKDSFTFPKSDANPPQDTLDVKLNKLIKAAPVMLFMKGSPAEPKCGFSKTIIALLTSLNTDYKTFDILTDQAVREGLKKLSDWPTYPQLYVNGDLIGGLDIIKEMHAAGELEPLLPKLRTLDERLKSLINKSPCMVFMKGDRQTPRCGFSRQLMEILTEMGCMFETFDILSDEEVRQGLKTYSDWPTYPQVYIKGDLIGGLDIIKEMKASGDLATALKNAT